MRKPIAAILLFCYSLALLGPVLPLIDYALRYDYYAQVLCENRDKPELKCNGTCKLAQLMKASEEAHQAVPNSSKTMEAPVLLVLFAPEPSHDFVPKYEESNQRSCFEFSEIAKNQWLPSPPVPPPWV
jgi:hypothetical protein